MHRRKPSSQTISDLDQSLLYQIHLEIADRNLDMLPEDKVNDIFELTMDILSSNDRPAMMMLPIEKKKLLINQVIQNKDFIGSKKSKNPSFYVDLINQLLTNTVKGRAEQFIDLVSRRFVQQKSSLGLKDVIMELKIQCQTQPMSWLKQFMECGGMAALFSVLDSMHSKPGR
jgi:hypothetical protein